MDNVLYPLRYHHLFGQALTFDELYFWQYHSHLSQKGLKRELSQLIKAKKIRFNQGFYFLNDFPFNLEKEKKYRQIAIQKENLARRRFQKLYKPKQIIFAALSGSVGAGFCHDNDDLDVVIVTKKKTLWLSRFLFYLLNRRLKRRRPGQKKGLKNLFCFNMWLEADQLKFPAHIYTATEILNLKPIYDPYRFYSLWLKENNWIKDIFPQAWRLKGNINQKSKKIIPGSNQEKILNFLAYFFQLLYMLPKRDQEKVSLSKAFFHRYNYPSLINERLKNNEDSFRPLRRR